MKKPLFASIIAIATLLTACGGATPAATNAPSDGATAGANPCAVPVRAKCPDEASELVGAGATFPAPIYTKWVSEYNKLTGIQINYQPVGSGGGIKSLTDKTVDYGATDGPMTEAQLAAAGGASAVLHIPMVMGAVVPTYNIPGVTASLKFTPEVLAGIYLEQIKKWNDPKITAINTGVTLPDAAITTVHRSDGSGTTYVWTDYLSKVSPEWKTRVGFANSVNWPGGLGASGNAGVAGSVKNTSGAIGYVELIYAIQNKLGYGTVQNSNGKFVEATLDSVTKAADGITLPADMRVSITNSENADAYPISTFTWTLAYTEIANKAKAIAIARYFWWSTHEGQAFAKDLGYAPLPTGVVTKAEGMIRAITTGGVAALPK
jgi:phosphate transport system substrate-binding protein